MQKRTGGKRLLPAAYWSPGNRRSDDVDIGCGEVRHAGEEDLHVMREIENLVMVHVHIQVTRRLSRRWTQVVGSRF